MTSLTAELMSEASGLLDRLREIITAAGDPEPPAPDSEPEPSEPAPRAPPALTAQNVTDAAAALSCSEGVIRAVCAVESNGRGFSPDGRVIILFEPHVFSRLTAHRFDATYGGVSYPRWGAKPYPPTQAARWDQLLFAAKLDHDAAFKSASWGLFQVMGFNFAACGFASVDEMVASMAQGEGDQLMAFVHFCLTNKLDDALRARDWSTFAAGYNGSAAVKDYSAKLSAAAAKYGV